MPTTANSITYYVAADGTLRDGPQGSIAQTPRINYGTEYSVTLTFPASTIAEGDQLQVALNRTRTFFSSASATGDAPVAAVAKHDVTAAEADAQAVTLTLSTNTRAMIDQVNGIDHPVRGFFGIHVLRGQSFVTLAVADALMMSLESGPDAISPSLPVVDYPTREEAIAIKDEALVAAGKAKEEADRAEEAAAGIVPPLQLSSPPTTSTVGSVGQLAVWHDSSATDQSKADHEYHLLYIVESAGGKEYIWREDVTENQGNVAGGYPVLDENGLVASAQLPPFSNAPEPIIATATPTTSTVGVVGQLYVNTATSKTYHCTAITNTGTESEPVWSYAWTDDINAKGGIFTSAIQVNSANNTANTRIKPQGHIDGGFNSDSGSSGYGSIAIGYNAKAMASHGAASFGAGTTAGYNSQLVTGKYNLAKDRARLTGNGTNNSIRKNIEELSWNGDLYIAGGHQQGITVIPAATTAYTLAEGIFTHAPTSAPAYTLPSITDDIRTHEVVLVIDFSSVQTFSFLVDGGGDVTFQSYANPTKGDVWAFRCWWYGGKWRIMPTKIKNCVTRQLTNGSLAITDAVGGNALALKMTAPRSVVVNQLSQSEDVSVWNTENVTATYEDGIITMTSTGGTIVGMKMPSTSAGYIKRHKYALYAEIKKGTATNVSFGWRNSSSRAAVIYTSTPSSKDWTPVQKIGATSDNIVCDLMLYIDNGSAAGIATQARNMMCVDLTAYFNGDTALINSITSWDDLVAYDPRFASYVEYNTGEVKGVIPAVSVNNGSAITSPDELFSVGSAADEFEAVSGRTEKAFKQVDLSSLTWTAGEGTYSATIADIKPSTQNILLPNGYAGTVSGTTLTITASATPSGTAIYESVTHATSITTPTQISLQAGSNTAMQTDGGRLAPIDITYESDEL